MWDSRYPSNHPLSRRSPLSSPPDLSTSAQPPSASRPESIQQLPETSRTISRVPLSTIDIQVDPVKEDESANKQSTSNLFPLDCNPSSVPPAQSPLSSTTSSPSTPVTSQTTRSDTSRNQSESSITITTPRKISTGGPKISPKAIYSIHAPAGYRPSRPNSPTTTSETIDPPYRLPSHSRSYLMTTTSPRKDEVIDPVLSAEVRRGGGGGGGGKTFEKESSSTTPLPLISIEQSPPPPPLTSSSQSQSPSSPEISKKIPGSYPLNSTNQTIDLLSDELPTPSPPLPSASSSLPNPPFQSSTVVVEGEGLVETNLKNPEQERFVKIGKLIDFEQPWPQPAAQQEEEEEVNSERKFLNCLSSQPVKGEVRYEGTKLKEKRLNTPPVHEKRLITPVVPEKRLITPKVPEKPWDIFAPKEKRYSETKEIKEVKYIDSEKESKTLNMLDESIQEIISLEAKIETVKSRAENDLEQIKSEYEGKLERERKEVERLKKENEELRKKKEESSSSEEEEFVYESLETKKEKMELESGGIKYEDRENQIGFDRLRTREELLELARSPLVKECAEVYVEGVLPTQMDARSLRSQTKPQPSAGPSQQSLVWKGGARSYSTPQIRQMEGLMYMNEKLRRELREAQETIEELMKELEGGDANQEDWSSPKSRNGGWD
ncbi:hypothetical protein JCM5350_007320 [Sporobolomyces pararoseus]